VLLRRKRQKIYERIGTEIIGGLCVVTMFIIFYSAFIEPQTLTVTTHNVHLPVVNSLKIAVISDLHIGPYKNAAFIEKIVSRTNQLLPDFIFLVGDYISSEEAKLDNLLPLRNLHASAGVFAVLGNHDQGMHTSLFRTPSSGIDMSEDITTILESLGITVLRNAHSLVELGTESLVIAGIDDLWTGNGNVEESLQDAPTARTTILLAHNPSVIDVHGADKANLIVSGHTHGGQIRLPMIGPISTLPIRIDQSYDQGIFPLENSRTLAITRGVGESWSRARFFAWPEILLINVD
jgi:uncharacterized protein